MKSFPAIHAVAAALLATAARANALAVAPEDAEEIRPGDVLAYRELP